MYTACFCVLVRDVSRKLELSSGVETEMCWCGLALLERGCVSGSWIYWREVAVACWQDSGELVTRGDREKETTGGKIYAQMDGEDNNVRTQ